MAPSSSVSVLLLQTLGSALFQCTAEEVKPRERGCLFIGSHWHLPVCLPVLMLFRLTPSFREWTEARALSPVSYHSMIPTHPNPRQCICRSACTRGPRSKRGGRGGWGGGSLQCYFCCYGHQAVRAGQLLFGSPKCCCVTPPVPRTILGIVGS